MEVSVEQRMKDIGMRLKPTEQCPACNKTDNVWDTKLVRELKTLLYCGECGHRWENRNGS